MNIAAAQDFTRTSSCGNPRESVIDAFPDGRFRE
jgi:hypothetical protein